MLRSVHPSAARTWPGGWTHALACPSLPPRQSLRLADHLFAHLPGIDGHLRAFTRHAAAHAAVGLVELGFRRVVRLFRFLIVLVQAFQRRLHFVVEGGITAGFRMTIGLPPLLVPSGPHLFVAGFPRLPRGVGRGTRPLFLDEPSPDRPVLGFVEQRLRFFDRNKLVHRRIQYIYTLKSRFARCPSGAIINRTPFYETGPCLLSVVIRRAPRAATEARNRPTIRLLHPSRRSPHGCAQGFPAGRYRYRPERADRPRPENPHPRGQRTEPAQTLRRPTLRLDRRRLHSRRHPGETAPHAPGLRPSRPVFLRDHLRLQTPLPYRNGPLSILHAHEGTRHPGCGKRRDVGARGPAALAPPIPVHPCRRGR